MSSRWSVGFDEAEQERLEGLCKKISSAFKNLEKTLDGIPISKFKKLGSTVNSLGNQFYDVQHSTWLELETRYNRLNQIKRSIVSVGDQFGQAVARSDGGTRLKFEDLLRKAGRDFDRSYKLLFQLEGSLQQSLLKSEILPSEKPSPVHVALIADRLVQVDKKTRAGDISDASLERLRSEAADFLGAALQDLRIASNVDGRYLSTLERFRRTLSDDFISVERLGLHYELACRLSRGFQDELSRTTFEQIDMALETTELILNQFEEWRLLLAEKKKKLTWSDPEAEILTTTTTEIAEALGERNDIYDPRIRDTLLRVLETFKEAEASSDVIAPPLIGAISNIFSKLAEAVINAGHLIQTTNSYLPTDSWYIIGVTSLVLINRFATKLMGFDALKFVNNALAYFKKEYPEISKSIE